MRGCFITGCKLLGVYILYSAIISFTSVIGQAVFLSTTLVKMYPDTNIEAISIGINILDTSLNAIFAFFLLFKSEWLADKVKIVDDSRADGRHVARPELRFGMILIGIYVFLTRIGFLAFTIWKTQVSHNLNRYGNPLAGTEPPGLAFSTDIIKPLIPVVLSLLMMFASRPIARFLMTE